jgi:TonB family protein
VAVTLRTALVAASAILLSIAVARRLSAVAGASEAPEVPPEALAALATAVVMPIYPQVSLESGKSGVVVALVGSDAAGRVRSVDILQSPDAAIATSVRGALVRWVFTPAEKRGRVIIYFTIENERGLVLTPKQLAFRLPLPR